MADGGRTHQERVCIDLPPKVNSPGLLGVQGTHLHPLSTLLNFSTPRLTLQISVFLFSSIFICRFINRKELPQIVPQIIVGLIFGNIHLLKDAIMGGSSKPPMVQDSVVKVVGTISSFGYTFFLFMQGLKMDPGLLLKVGPKAVTLAVLSVIIPLAAVFSFRDLLFRVAQYQDFPFSTPGLFILSAMSSFPVIHILLTDLKILNSELGRFALSAALISDLFSHFIMLAFRLLAEPVTGSIWLNIVMSCSFIAGLVALRFGLKWLIRGSNTRGSSVRDELIHLLLLLFMVSPSISTYCGLFRASGPFLLGLAVPEGPPLGSAIVDKFEPVMTGLLLPLLTVTCALRIDLQSLNTFSSNHVGVSMLLGVFITMAAKFLVTLLLLLFTCKMPARDSLALTLVLSTKGIIEFAIFSFSNDAVNMFPDLFAAMGLIILGLATFVPLMVNQLYEPSGMYRTYDKRNIMHCRPNQELKVLACIDSPSNIISMINMLDASSPSPLTPVALDVLHLVHLRARATPLFISHQRTPTVSSTSYSDTVAMSAINTFERENHASVTVHVFTAVSPASLMHEDICYLALDRHTSFIILPFHRRRFPNGSVESEDTILRNVNCKVLDRAPCSVGILVEGSRPTKRSNCSPERHKSYRMAVIFLGGEDDREALAFAYRAAHDHRRVTLTIVHLKSGMETMTIMDTYDKVWDDEALGFGKKKQEVRFVEEEVNGGAETVRYLKSIGDEFDLIVVGRRKNQEYNCSQTSGLVDGIELPELGVMGDLLASKDINCGSSVLVVRQQISHQFHRNKIIRI